MTKENKEIERLIKEYKIKPSKQLFTEDSLNNEILEWFENIKLDLIDFIHSSLQLNDKNKTNIIGFENYIAKVHPDPDSVLIDNIQRWKQIVLLAENYAKQ